MVAVSLRWIFEVRKSVFIPSMKNTAEEPFFDKNFGFMEADL